IKHLNLRTRIHRTTEIIYIFEVGNKKPKAKVTTLKIKVLLGYCLLLRSLTQGKRAPFTNFDPSTLLPSSLDYWTYFGSLTHPPLHESVIWIICKESIGISPEQLAQFRSLLSNVEGDKAVPIQHNNRPPQPLKGRIVKASF
uniref:Carbonic anhydrase 1 n=1 Tax=Felis catus TaxID=9685 RepID=A0ABI7XWR0_FELCA